MPGGYHSDPDRADGNGAAKGNDREITSCKIVQRILHESGLGESLSIQGLLCFPFRGEENNV